MKNLLRIITIALVAAFLFTSCGGKIKGSNVVGDWYQEISRNMGGSQISAKTKLTIIRNGPGDYVYRLETTIVDEMYGGQPKTNYSSGSFEKDINDETTNGFTDAAEVAAAAAAVAAQKRQNSTIGSDSGSGAVAAAKGLFQSVFELW
jgi:hypothetical protein